MATPQEEAEKRKAEAEKVRAEAEAWSSSATGRQACALGFELIRSYNDIDSDINEEILKWFNCLLSLEEKRHHGRLHVVYKAEFIALVLLF